ncbi:Hsp70 family protein [Oligoflexus tunisiensis]|uniref:Hsp70 family protein n=1 Tax=Oligoflexus tunisiensis TaxID=708132 RepID=UPI000ADFB9EE|nr:Hsp70 family protein [Oligoflexus tunisiensis]
MSETTPLVRGIDLGTSNSAMAEADLSGSVRRLQPIAQLDGPGRIIEHELLPSVAYLADHRDMSPADLALPWDITGHAPLVGRWARDLALLNPEKAILSAKSWLCYGGQKLARLPQGAPEEKSWTAVQASAAYLRHMQAAWELKHQDVQPELTVLTVPASFDLVARQLTEEAAKQAGLASVTLLEEPLAAFYAWLGAHEQHWQDVLKPGDLVLICDIGGGTSDFSLIAVSQDQRMLRLDRIAVGRHLLLGGDNMDLALAHHVQAQMGTTLDTWQFLSLQQQVRVAKEGLLSLNAPSHWPLAIASRGSNLFAQTLRYELHQQTVQDLLVEGFFPLVKADEEIPRPTRSTGLARMGLPYENDPAITRHLLQFLRQAQTTIRQSQELQERLGDAYHSDQKMVTPTAILFNGGVFHSGALRDRVFTVAQNWAGHTIKELQSPGFDHAVALGAAYFGRLQAQGVGVRVRAAAARSYYIGLESNEPAVPGLVRPLRGLCILPQGTEEGSHLALPEQEFGLWTGDDISFRLFSSATRSGDRLGTIVPDAEGELEEVSELHAQIESEEEQGLLPVHLRADLTDVGSLQLAMQHSQSERQWNLEFHLREEAGSGHA